MKVETKEQVIENYKKEQSKKIGKVFYLLFGIFGSIGYMIAGIATIIFCGVMGLAFAKVNAQELIPWLLFPIVASLASIFTAIDLLREFIEEDDKNE